MGNCCGANSIESDEIGQQEITLIKQKGKEKETGLFQKACHECCKSYNKCILKPMLKPDNFKSRVSGIKPDNYYNEKYAKKTINVFDANVKADDVKEDMNFDQALEELQKEHHDFFAVKVTGFEMNDGQVEDILKLCKTQRMICYLYLSIHYSCFEQEHIWTLILQVLQAQYSCKVFALRFLMDNVTPSNNAFKSLINEVNDYETGKYVSLEEKIFDFEELDEKKQILLRQNSGFQIEI